MTYRDLIQGSLQDLMVLTGGATVNPDDAAAGLTKLNDWIDALALQGLIIYTTTRTTWNLVALTASYTIGVGATVNVARPVSPNAIGNLGFIDTTVSPVLERTFGCPLTESAYQQIPQKTLTSPYPNQWYYDPTFPTGTLKPFPIPTSSSLQGVIYSDAPLTEVLLTDTVSLPPGFRRFLRAGLAIELAPVFEKTVPSSVLKAYRETEATIKATNLRMVDLVCDPALICRRLGSDIYSGNA